MDSKQYLAALTLVGLAMTTLNATADEMIVIASAKSAVESSTANDAPRPDSELAREATLEAAKQAVDAVLSNTKKDLDFHFLGTTSDTAAGDEATPAATNSGGDAR